MTERKLYCSFCGKSQFETYKLIAGPTVFICDECVATCAEIVDRDRRAEMAAGSREMCGADIGVAVVQTWRVLP